jgi:hypothetical protein
MPPKYRAVESVLGYKITNKSLLVQDLHPKRDLRPVESTLERLEYLGDALDFIHRHFPDDSKLAMRVQMSVCNKVLQATSLETGLYESARACSEDLYLDGEIAAAKASWEAAKQGIPEEGTRGGIGTPDTGPIDQAPGCQGRQLQNLQEARILSTAWTRHFVNRGQSVLFMVSGFGWILL